VDNAIVIVEHPVKDEQLEHLSKLFNIPKLSVNDQGYLNNLQLHFPNECGRHKLLDLIGDLRLVGGYLNAKITAFKPGHTINTNTAKAIRELLKQHRI
jgi:UDP-3-O-[3-hydroxymyristoyl] N-acetylglucosamine deacetylase/3-hydroxyacyl-[acyl-carrier-protein] dehydratase